MPQFVQAPSGYFGAGGFDPMFVPVRQISSLLIARLYIPSRRANAATQDLVYTREGPPAYYPMQGPGQWNAGY